MSGDLTQPMMRTVEDLVLVRLELLRDALRVCGDFRELDGPVRVRVGAFA
jgi:hypothetical protein